MRGGNKIREWYGSTTIERIARATGISEQGVERVLEELGRNRPLVVVTPRSITWRRVVTFGLWMVGILFAFISLVVLMLSIAGR